jgi:hypothetical protein
MHDLLALPGPLFSAPCGTAGGAHVTAVNAPEAVIEAPFPAQLDLKFFDEGCQQPFFSPLIEEVIDRLPRRVFFGQVAPGRTRSDDPKDAIERRPAIRRRPTGIRSARKQILNTFPLLIRELVTGHSIDLQQHPCVKSSWKSGIFAKLGKDRFSDRA